MKKNYDANAGAGKALITLKWLVEQSALKVPFAMNSIKVF